MEVKVDNFVVKLDVIFVCAKAVVMFVDMFFIPTNAFVGNASASLGVIIIQCVVIPKIFTIYTRIRKCIMIKRKMPTYCCSHLRQYLHFMYIFTAWNKLYCCVKDMRSS